MLTFRCPSCGALNRVPEARLSDAPVCGRCKKCLDLANSPQDVTADELAQVVEGAPVPVFVDFWAPWCGPCRMAAPIVDSIAHDASGRLLVVKLNSDDHPEASRRAGVEGIPTFMIFRDGKEIARQSGLPSPAALRAWVNQRLT
jgi:thioredoxin 2